MANISRYQAGKERARQKAKDYQKEVCDLCLSWWDVAHMADYFERLAKRYGLLTEFKENGVI